MNVTTLELYAKDHKELLKEIVECLAPRNELTENIPETLDDIKITLNDISESLSTISLTLRNMCDGFRADFNRKGNIL